MINLILSIGIVVTIIWIFYLFLNTKQICPNCKTEVNESSKIKLRQYDKYTCHNCGEVFYKEY